MPAGKGLCGPERANLVRQRGVVLLLLLLLMLLASAALSYSLQVMQTERRRDQEQELIRIGLAYRAAIRRYYEQTPGIVKSYPPTLDALLNDTRFPQPRQHLRQRYQDPVTGRPGWGTVESQNRGIMGVYSLSAQVPLKTTGYYGKLAMLNGKRSYTEWYFVYTPGFQ